jgi:hypothetical protein
VWLRLVTTTVGLAGHFNYRQPYDHSAACPTCGAGALPIGPLTADLSKMGKKLLDQTAHDGHLVVSRKLADALLAAAATGIDVRPVRRPHRTTPDSEYRWLRVVAQWPRMAPTSQLATDDRCPECQRTGYFDVGRRPGEWHYRAPPDAAGDFGLTWERFGYWRARGWEPGVRGVGAAGGVIVSDRMRALFESLRVRHVEYVPVVFDGPERPADGRS